MTDKNKIDFLSFLSEDEKKSSVDITEIKDVSEASNHYLKVESDILSLEEQIKLKKLELQQTNDTIVTLMESRGVKSIKLMSGDAVSFTPFYKGHISKANEAEAFGWLEQNNHGELIKNIVSIQFGKGENDKASKLINSLQADGLSPDQKRKVESMTLNAFLKEQINKGENIPIETFGVFIGNKVKIKRGK